MTLDSAQIKVASLISPQLYLSDYGTTQNEAKLKELGITHVVSLLFSGAPKLPNFIPDHRRLYIHIEDTTESNIGKHLATTTDFITTAVSEDPTNKVLVHCRRGICRSATVVCAYLVATTDMSVSQAIRHVKSLRKVVSLNYGFRSQLETYGRLVVRAKPKPSET